MSKNLEGPDVSGSAIQASGVDVEEVLGPAFLSFADSESFRPVKNPNCRKLTEADAEVLEELKSKSDKGEIDNSISEYNVQDDVLFGKFVEGELVAVSGYRTWNDEIAFIVVFVAEEYRGKGFGKQVVSQVVESALNNNLIPIYRTLEEWNSSVNLAFEKYATTCLVEMKEE